MHLGTGGEDGHPEGARIKTMQIEYNTVVARLAEDIAKRDRDNTRWMVGLWVAAVVVIIAVLGFLSRTGA